MPDLLPPWCRLAWQDQARERLAQAAQAAQAKLSPAGQGAFGAWLVEDAAPDEWELMGLHAQALQRARELTAELAALQASPHEGTRMARLIAGSIQAQLAAIQADPLAWQARWDWAEREHEAHQP